MRKTTIKRFSLEEVRKLQGSTDWDRLRAEEDAGLEPAHDPDIDDVDWDWSTARLVEPEPKKMISVRLDADVLEFFKSQGKGYQTRMNAVLRSYMEAMRKSGSNSA